MSRDDQFLGFARALVDDIRHNIDMNTDERLPYDRLIAQRAYDLVRHALYCDALSPLAWGHASDIYEREVDKRLAAIPDMAVLPEETQCICGQYAGVRGFASWDCPEHGKCSTGWFEGELKPEEASE